MMRLSREDFYFYMIILQHTRIDMKMMRLSMEDFSHWYKKKIKIAHGNPLATRPLQYSIPHILIIKSAILSQVTWAPNLSTVNIDDKEFCCRYLYIYIWELHMSGALPVRFLRASHTHRWIVQVADISPGRLYGWKSSFNIPILPHSEIYSLALRFKKWSHGRQFCGDVIPLFVWVMDILCGDVIPLFVWVMDKLWKWT